MPQDASERLADAKEWDECLPHDSSWSPWPPVVASLLKREGRLVEDPTAMEVGRAAQDAGTLRVGDYLEVRPRYGVRWGGRIRSLAIGSEADAHEIEQYGATFGIPRVRATVTLTDPSSASAQERIDGRELDLTMPGVWWTVWRIRRASPTAPQQGQPTPSPDKCSTSTATPLSASSVDDLEINQD